MKEYESNKFNKTAYNNAYNKEKYKNIALRCKPSDYETIEQFCQDLQISKNKFMINCALYIINHDMIDEIRAYKPRED